MKKVFLCSVLTLISIVTLAQSLASQKSVRNISFDRDNAALGISDNALKRQEKMVNPPTNIALFGVDKREEGDQENSDVIMIVSIDQEKGKVKMASIMRDTYVEIEGLGKDKINAAYATGGPQLAIKTLNQNFDLDIRDYINVDFYRAAKIVDALGGVAIDVKEEELPYLNNYLNELSNYEDEQADHLQSSGLQKLNGRQAVAFTRIRAVGNGDYERTERQRAVMTALFDKMKEAGQEMMPVFAFQVFPNLETSMSNRSLLSFATAIMDSKNKSIDQARFPLDSHSAGERIDGIWYLTSDLKSTSNAIHQFIFD